MSRGGEEKKIPGDFYAPKGGVSSYQKFSILTKMSITDSVREG